MNPLRPWMHWLLVFVGGYNLLAGLSFLVFYHESFKLLGVPKPEFLLPVQLVGILVGLFGVGYWMVAWNPLENRNVLLLGFLSKLLGSVLAIVSVVVGAAPPILLLMVFVSDIVYLPPFWRILRRLRRFA
jgi:small multidrug resistance pump